MRVCFRARLPTSTNDDMGRKKPFTEAAAARVGGSDWGMSWCETPRSALLQTCRVCRSAVAHGLCVDVKSFRDPGRCPASTSMEAHHVPSAHQHLGRRTVQATTAGVLGRLLDRRAVLQIPQLYAGVRGIPGHLVRPRWRTAVADRPAVARALPALRGDILLHMNEGNDDARGAVETLLDEVS